MKVKVIYKIRGQTYKEEQKWFERFIKNLKTKKESDQYERQQTKLKQIK